MNDIGSTSPYFSFLICSHANGALINAYVNGQAIGTIRDSVFNPHVFSHPGGTPTPITLNQLPNPFPFAALADMKAMLHQVIERLEVPTPVQPNA